MTQAFSDTNLVIRGATGASLALGRLVFLPIQRAFNAKVPRPRPALSGSEVRLQHISKRLEPGGNVFQRLHRVAVMRKWEGILMVHR